MEALADENEPHTLGVDVSAFGRGTFTLDGFPLRKVTGFRIEGGVNEITRVTLTLYANVAGEVAAVVSEGEGDAISGAKTL